MSKEKLSAEALYPVWFEQHGRELIVDCLYPFAEWYAEQVAEQLQREREEAINLLQRIYNIKSVWACKKGEPTSGIFYAEDFALLTMESEIKAILTPKPEKK